MEGLGEKTEAYVSLISKAARDKSGDLREEGTDWKKARGNLSECWLYLGIVTQMDTHLAVHCDGGCTNANRSRTLGLTGTADPCHCQTAQDKAVHPDPNLPLAITNSTTFIIKADLTASYDDQRHLLYSVHTTLVVLGPQNTFYCPTPDPSHLLATHKSASPAGSHG